MLQSESVNVQCGGQNDSYGKVLMLYLAISPTLPYHVTTPQLLRIGSTIAKLNNNEKTT